MAKVERARSLIWHPGSGHVYMVFSSLKRYAWMRERLGGDEVVSHGGSHPFDGSQPQATVAVLSDRTVLAVVVNSPFPTDSRGLRDAVVEAYRMPGDALGHSLSRSRRGRACTGRFDELTSPPWSRDKPVDMRRVIAIAVGAVVLYLASVLIKRHLKKSPGASPRHHR